MAYMLILIVFNVDVDSPSNGEARLAGINKSENPIMPQLQTPLV